MSVAFKNERMSETKNVWDALFWDTLSYIRTLVLLNLALDIVFEFYHNLFVG